MAKEVAGLIKLQIKGGAANPSPPVGPVLRYGHFPLGIFNTVSFSVHKAIKIDPNRIEEQMAEVEAIVKAGIKE